MDEPAPQLLGRTRHRDRAATSSRPRSRSRRNPAAPVEEREAGRAVARGAGCGRGRRTTTSRPSRTCRPIRSCRTRSCAVELEAEQMVVLGPLATGADPRRCSRSAWRSSWCSARSTKTTSTSTWCGSGHRHDRGASAMSADHEIAVLGVGHAPVGQVGPQLRRVRRGRRAGRARRRGRRRGATSSSCPAPTRCATATRATSPARRSRRRSAGKGAQVASSYAACASGVTALSTRAGADPRRVLRRRARRRRRHHAEGLPRTEHGRAGRRSRLAALPAARRDQPDLLRAVRAPAHGALRRDPRRLRHGEGEERAPRARATRTRGTARK